MGKISTEARKRYFDRIKQYKSTVEQIIQREKSILKVIESQEQGKEFKKIVLAEEMLNMVSYFVLMNELSVTLLGVKNENFLNDGRKGIYKAIIYLEEVVSGSIDAPFADYEENLLKIDEFDDQKRWDLIRKLGFSIDSLKDAYGENTKWKWSFVELEGRFGVIVKNFINLKSFVAKMDPRVPGYEVRMEHLGLAKKLLQQSADRYREKYELSTNRIDDFKLAIRYLAALRRLHLLLGEGEQSDMIKKKMDIWRSKMDGDQRIQEQKKKSGKVNQGS